MAILLALCIFLSYIAGGANYMYEKANVKGVGYKNVEMIIQTQTGQDGNKLVEKESGSGNVIVEKTEIEAARDYDPSDLIIIWVPFLGDSPGKPTGKKDENGPYPWIIIYMDPCCPDYINFTKEAELEYMPVSYQTGTYDQKWIEKLCVQNYDIGGVVTEQYTNVEHLQKRTVVKTGKDCIPIDEIPLYPWDEDPCGYCDGTLEAKFNSNVIGVAHIGWLSKNVSANDKGRHSEYGRSVEDLTGVFSIEKFIQLWGNGCCDEVKIDWLPCI